MRRLVVAWTALCALAGAALADGPAGEGPLKDVTVGWDGAQSGEVPTPISVVLEHPGPGELTASLVVRSGSESRTEELSLPAGARRRVSLGLRLMESTVLIQLRRGDELLATRQVEISRYIPESPAHLLALDGRPPGRRGGGDQRWNDTLLPLISAGVEHAPSESACYLGFSAVYLRGVEPDALPDGARAALIEHVAQGGTVLIAPAEGVATAPMLGLFPAGLPASQGPFGRELALGLGRVVVLEQDLLARATSTSAEGIATARELGVRVAAAVQPRRIPWIHDELDSVMLTGPGLPTRLLILGFLGLYFLVVCPGLMLFGRRIKRVRLFKWVVVLVAVFTLLAPVVAGLVRAAPGTAYVRTALWVPSAGGPAIELGDVTVVSGGSARAELVLGGGPLAATAHPADAERIPDWDGRRFGMRPPAISAPVTRHGETVRFQLAMSPWGRQSVSTFALVPRPSPVRAELSPDGGLVTLQNTGGEPLRDALLMEADAPAGPEAPYVWLGEVPAGTRREVTVPQHWGRQVDLRFEPGWADRLGVSPSFACWGTLRAPLVAGEAAPRLFLLSRTESRVRVEGYRLNAVVNALRIDPVLLPATAVRGFAGFKVADQNGSLTIREVAPGGPAAAAGLTQGDIILSIDDQGASSAAALRERLARRLAGDRIRLRVWTPGRRGQRDLDLVLEARPRIAGGD